jgi:hypothetical protein
MATKTPASSHGHHFPGLSVSSQPSSTPFAAAAIHDELLKLDSPAAALINSIAQAGMTPLTGGPDGLGLGSQPNASTSRGAQPARSPEAERLHKVSDAVEKLKRRVIGRGITRDGIERVARLHGLEALWDEDNLIIAGTVVEIEINFSSENRNAAKDLSLKFNYDDEVHVQSAGADVLRTQAGLQAQQGQPVNDMEDFARNIQYLAQLDQIDVKPNCFQLVTNLYESFREIWDEEKKRMHWRDELQQIRQGAVGRPNMDRAPELGLTVDYWIKPEALSRNPKQDLNTQRGDYAQGVWRQRIYCEPGAPSMRSARRWVTEKVLTDGPPGHNVLDAQDAVYKPDWHDPATGLGLTTTTVKSESTMEVDKLSSDGPQTLNVHFTSDLLPEVLLPLNALSRLNNAEVIMVEIDATKASTFERALQRMRNRKLKQADDGMIESRWDRDVPFLESDGSISHKRHAYKLYANPQEAELWCYPVNKVKFSHPRQLAELLPLVRQHIVVWSLLETLVAQPPSDPKTVQQRQSQSKETKGVIKRSNRHKGSNAATKNDSLNVDITVDVMSDVSKVRMELFVPLLSKHGASTKLLHLALQVLLNGVVQVVGIDGLGDHDMEGLKMKVGKMITATEDLGLVVQWLQMRAA